MDLTLTEEQKEFRQLARDFVNKEVVPHRAAWDRAESVDTAIVEKLADIGFFGMTIPEEYGGLGGDYITYCLGMEELGRADSAVRGIVSVSMGLVGKVILSHGTEDQKHEWLPRIASGEALACFGLTEPDNGSDPGNLKTKAVRSGDDYVINGSKIFITNGTWAKLCLVFARTGGPGPKGFRPFWFRRTPRDSNRARSAESSDCAGRRRPSCPSRTSASPRVACSDPRGRVSPSRCTRWTRVACRWARVASESSRAASRPPSPIPASARSSTVRSPRSNSCRT